MPPLDKQSSRSDPAAPQIPCRGSSGGSVALGTAAPRCHCWGREPYSAAEQHPGSAASTRWPGTAPSQAQAPPQGCPQGATCIAPCKNPTAPRASPTNLLLLLRATPARPIHHAPPGQRHQQNTLFPRVLQVNKPSVPELPIATGTSMCVPIASQG